jgi:hypothetical protein
MVSEGKTDGPLLKKPFPPQVSLSTRGTAGEYEERGASLGSWQWFDRFLHLTDLRAEQTGPSAEHLRLAGT